MRGADCIAVTCPMCHNNLDTPQDEVRASVGIEQPIPVIFATQLMGLAFGLSPEDGQVAPGVDARGSANGPNLGLWQPQRTTESDPSLSWGGGIAGMQASLDCANAGFKVYLLEQDPAIGGNMARLDKTFPTNDCAMCMISPKLVETGRHLNIEIISYADLKKVEGEAGDFTP